MVKQVQRRCELHSRYRLERKSRGQAGTLRLQQARERNRDEESRNRLQEAEADLVCSEKLPEGKRRR